MSWLSKLLPPKIKSRAANNAKSVPEGLWSKCPSCETVLYRTDLEQNAYVCPKCEHHGRISARTRLDMLLDQDARVEIGASVLPVDILKFKDSKKYPDRMAAAEADSGETDAMVVMRGSILCQPATVAAFEYKYIGGSMGSVVGERFWRGVQAAVEHKTAFICVTASGGARMQEGLHSLLQMAKTSAAINLLQRERLPFITLLTDPTMGGVSASFAFLGDVVLAEPGALIGFAGPRVIEQTVRETLPEGFQRAEFLLEKGAIDQIVDRRQLRDKLAGLISMLRNRPHA